MTSSPGSDPRDPDGAPDPAAKLERLARRANWTLVWEQVWPPLAWALAVVALFLAASWFGLWFVAPRPLHFVLLALFALALLAALFPLVKLRWPSRAEALARLDRDAMIAHRPASGFEDELANGAGDETTNALWALHRARLARQVDNLSLAPPAPRMAWRDPRALRFGALLLAVRRRARGGAGALCARCRRFRRPRRRRGRRAAARRRLDRSARLYQQAAAAPESRRTGEAGKPRRAGRFRHHRAQRFESDRGACRRRADAGEIAGAGRRRDAAGERQRSARAKIRRQGRRQAQPHRWRLAAGVVRDFLEPARQRRRSRSSIRRKPMSRDR